MIRALQELRRITEALAARQSGQDPLTHRYIGRFWADQVTQAGREMTLARGGNLDVTGRANAVVMDSSSPDYLKEYFLPGYDLPGDPTKVLR